MYVNYQALCDCGFDGPQIIRQFDALPKSLETVP